MDLSTLMTSTRRQSAMEGHDVEVINPTLNKAEETNVYPLIYAATGYQVQFLRKSAYALRQLLPLKVKAIIERRIGDNRFIISLPHLHQGILEMQRKLNEGYQDPVFVETGLVVGDTYIYRDDHSQHVRVRVLATSGSKAKVRLIDYGVVTEVIVSRRFIALESGHAEKSFAFAYTMEVQLPPNDETSGLVFTSSNLLRSGDLVEVTICSPTEPHLALMGLVDSRLTVEPSSFGKGMGNFESNWRDMIFKNYGNCYAIPRGYPFMPPPNQSIALGVVAYARRLDEVTIRDMNTCLRLPYLKEALKIAYDNASMRQKAAVTRNDVHLKDGFVAYYAKRDTYYRVEVVGFGEGDEVDVVAIDVPSRVPFKVSVEHLFKVFDAFVFPRQYVNCRVARHSETLDRQHINELLRCLMPEGTPVTFGSTNDGLVEIYSRNAADPLKETGFDDMGLMRSEHFSNEYDTYSKKFGAEKKVGAMPPSSIFVNLVKNRA